MRLYEVLSLTIPFGSGSVSHDPHKGWTFLPPVRRCARPASAILLEVGHPVRLLQLGIQLAQVPGEVIDTLLEVVYVDGADELDFIP